MAVEKELKTMKAGSSTGKKLAGAVANAAENDIYDNYYKFTKKL